MSNETKMTKRVALFREQKYDFVTVFPSNDNEDYLPTDYVRISEWMTVDFKSLSVSEIAGAELATLTKLKEKTVNDFREKLDFIEGRIANLRALTGPEAS